jgi:hypothetical protein
MASYNSQTSRDRKKRKALKELFLVSIIIFTVIFIFSIFVNVQSVSQLRKTPSGDAQTIDATLTVDAGTEMRPFNDEMRGIGLVNWEHSWGKPFPNNVPGLSSAISQIRPGIIRYAGGLWANSVGFDRQNQRTPYTSWTKNGMTYSFHYGLNEIDGLGALANQVNANVMVQGNISNNDPSMWADMVQYARKEKGYRFTSWEFGNELDLDENNKMTPAQYGQRLPGYINAIKAVDSTVGVRGAAVAFGVVQNDATNALSDFLKIPQSVARSTGKELDALTWHWYQHCNEGNPLNVTKFSWESGITDNSWRNAYVRRWAALMPNRVRNEGLSNYPQVKQGVTELNVDACNFDNVLNSNHIGAIWFADILGRLAYNGVDFVTMYNAYGTQSYSMLYPNNGDNPTRIYARPTFYTYLMYSKYFGNKLVKTTSSNESDISVWASKFSNDNSKIAILVTNLSNRNLGTSLNVNGFNAQSGEAYQMTSSNPTDMSQNSNTDQSTTRINGIKIDAMNVPGSLAQVRPLSVSVNGNSVFYSFPAYSTTAIILNTSQPNSTQPPIATQPPATNPPTPTNSPVVTATPRPTATSTPRPSPTPPVTILPAATPTARPPVIPTVRPTSSPIVTGSGSKIEIYAAGIAARNIYPTMALRVNNHTVARFTDIKGNPDTRNFIKFEYTDPAKLQHNQIRVAFTNDYFNWFRRQDRNLRVDKIVLDGIIYESEAPGTYSTGTWASGDGCSSGNKQSEWLHCRGYFQY